MQSRYKIEKLPLLSAAPEYETLEIIARQRACIKRGGALDLNKAAEIVLNELRDGSLGRISFETPEMMVAEEIDVQRIKAEKEAKDKLRKNARKSKKRR